MNTQKIEKVNYRLLIINTAIIAMAFGIVAGQFVKIVVF